MCTAIFDLQTSIGSRHRFIIQCPNRKKVTYNIANIICLLPQAGTSHRQRYVKVVNINTEKKHSKNAIISTNSRNRSLLVGLSVHRRCNLEYIFIISLNLPQKLIAKGSWIRKPSSKFIVLFLHATPPIMVYQVAPWKPLWFSSCNVNHLSSIQESKNIKIICTASIYLQTSIGSHNRYIIQWTNRNKIQEPYVFPFHRQVHHIANSV